MKSKLTIILALSLLLTVVSQARHKPVAAKLVTSKTDTRIVKENLQVTAGADLSPVHYLVLDI